MKILAFHGVRDGVGASFVTASCAYRMTVTNSRVLAVDAHPCASSLKRFFNLPMHVDAGWLDAARAAMNRLPIWRYAENLDVLAACADPPRAEEPWAERFAWLLQRAARQQFDAVVIDAGPVSSGASEALRAHEGVLSVTVVEPDASCLARLSEHAFGPSELLLVNKCNPQSVAHRDVNLAMNAIDALGRRLIPVSIPLDEFALQSCLVKRPVAQGLAFAQSAESINNLVTWLENYMRRDGEA